MRWKKMKRCAVVCLIVSMSFTLFGCGTAKVEEDATTSKEEDAVHKDKRTFEDLGGMDIKIGDWWTDDEDKDKEESLTQYEDMTLKYQERIMDEYNFTITREAIASWSDIEELFTTSALNNDPIAQICYLYQTQVAKPLQAGMFYDLSTLQSFDFSEEKWNKNVTKLMTVGDGIFGMQTEREPRGGIFYNKRFFEEVGLDPEEPYNLQESGEWTWDRFVDYCKLLTKDVDGDGQTDQYAMAGFSKDYYKLCVASNGGLFVGMDKSGKYYNATGESEFMEAVLWGTQLIEDGYVMPKPEGANWDWFINAFRNCEVAMQYAEVYQTAYWKDMEDDYGFVMFPAGPNGRMATVPMDNIIVIPSCIEPEEAEKIAFAYDLYTEPDLWYEENEIWKNDYRQSFKDDRAVDETLAMMRQYKYQVFDNWSLIYGLDIGDFVYSVYALDKAPKKQLEVITPAWDSLIDEKNKYIGNEL